MSTTTYPLIDQKAISDFFEQLITARLEDPDNEEIVRAIRRLGQEIKNLMDTIADVQIAAPNQQEGTGTFGNASER